MNQEITISTNTVDYLLRTYKDRQKRRKEIFKLLDVFEQNIKATDSKGLHFAEWIEKFESSDIPYKEQLRFIIEDIIDSGHTKIKTYDLNKSEFNELAIAEVSSDKIYFDPCFSKQEIKSVLKRKPEIEIHDSESFLNPQPFHRLKNCPAEIELNKDCYYDIQKIFRPFLSDCKRIVIRDQYLPNYKARIHLREILELNKKASFQLQLLDRRNYCRLAKKDFSFYQSFNDEIENYKKNGLKIKLYWLEVGHTERYIETEHFKIRIPGGLDIWDENGIYNNEYATIGISEIEENSTLILK